MILSAEEPVLKKNKVQIALLIIIAALLSSNLYVSHLLYKKNDTPPVQDTGNNQGNYTDGVMDISSDITKLVDQTQNKVVSVINMKSNQQAGSGSGVVYKNDKGRILIVTNHHVIDGGNGVVVRFSDGQEIEGKVLGSDVYTDLALIEVMHESDVDAFKLGDSTKTKVGEYVIAIGSPLGIAFENSVTYGIISGVNRMVPVSTSGKGESDWDMLVLQTDAAINPGNSGGALVNMAGELIGINSLKLASNNVEGMGFSIPVSEMISIIQQIEETGKVTYPKLGISMVSVEDLSPYSKQQYGIHTQVTEGIAIVEVDPLSAADKAGLKSGDVINEIEGAKVSTFKDFRRKLFEYRPGDEIELTITQGTNLKKVKVILGD